jgi:hypothetical protein
LMQAAVPRIAQVASIPIRTASARRSRRWPEAAGLHVAHSLLVARRSFAGRSRSSALVVAAGCSRSSARHRSRSSTLAAGRCMFYRKEKKQTHSSISSHCMFYRKKRTSINRHGMFHQKYWLCKLCKKKTWKKHSHNTTCSRQDLARRKQNKHHGSSRPTKNNGPARRTQNPTAKDSSLAALAV